MWKKEGGEQKLKEGEFVVFKSELTTFVEARVTEGFCYIGGGKEGERRGERKHNLRSMSATPTEYLHNSG